jgi:Big-like domain-containing protein
MHMEAGKMFKPVATERNAHPWSRVIALALIVVGLGFLTAACGSSSTAPSAVNTVTVTGAAPAVGASAQYSAVANLSNGTTENVTTTATWTSSNPDIATVSASGVVTAMAEGTVSINATFDNITGSAQAAVLPAQAP